MIELVKTECFGAHGLVLIEGDSVWLTFSRPWWDIFEQVRWFLTSGKERIVLLRVDEGEHRVRVRAKRIAKMYVKLG